MFALYQGFVALRLVHPNIDIWQYAEVLRAFFHGTFWQGGRRPSDADPAVPPAVLNH